MNHPRANASGFRRSAILRMAGLVPLMERSTGIPEIAIGLIDGPVATEHPDFAGAPIRAVAGGSGLCNHADSFACIHGTFVAGILSARENSELPGICPGCTLLVRPIFAESNRGGTTPNASPSELAEAIVDTVKAGARVINLSVALAQPSAGNQPELKQALDHAARNGAIVIAAAGNQGTLGSTGITRHPWTVPVVACDTSGRPMNISNLGSSIGRRGLSAPGEEIAGVGSRGAPVTFGGTSAATPFVTGGVALLWSEFPSASPAEIRSAITRNRAPGKPAIVPPVFNAWAVYQTLSKLYKRR